MRFIQRDLGTTAESSSGGGDRGLLKELVTLAVFITATLTAVYFIVVGITEAMVSRISPERE
ncbi:MAG: hypothetical protein AAF191_16905, partial [Verrucomicrobiota bacterium]